MFDLCGSKPLPGWFGALFHLLALRFTRFCNSAGNWKLGYKICMWITQDKYDGQTIVESYPNVCSLEPIHGSAFCAVHSKVVEGMGYPIQIREFIRRCQVDPVNYTREGKNRVRSVLQSLSKNEAKGDDTESAEEAQGTGYLLRNRQIVANTTQMTAEEDDKCRKDIGDVRRRIHSWSRGVMVVVGGKKEKQTLIGHLKWFYF